MPPRPVLRAGEELPSPLPPLVRVGRRLRAARGHDVPTYHFEPAPPLVVCSLVVSHGYSNYTSAGTSWLAHVLSPFGVQVWALDYTGHGAAAGAAPGLVADFGHLTSDLVAVAGAARAAHPGAPVFALGESMGGAVALLSTLAATEGGGSGNSGGRCGPFDGVVAMAPMAGISRGDAPHWAVELLGRAVAAVAPSLPIMPTRDIAAACFADPQRLEELAASPDPHRYAGTMRIGTALQFKDAMGAVQARAAEMTTPLLILHGTGDLVTCPNKSRAVYEAAASNDKTLLLVQDAWHVLWWETHATRAAVLADIVRWLHDRSPAAVAAGLGTPPQLPHAALETRPARGGPFRVPGGHPLTPWTFHSHGAVGCGTRDGGVVGGGEEGEGEEGAGRGGE